MTLLGICIENLISVSFYIRRKFLSSKKTIPFIRLSRKDTFLDFIYFYINNLILGFKLVYLWIAYIPLIVLLIRKIVSYATPLDVMTMLFDVKNKKSGYSQFINDLSNKEEVAKENMSNYFMSNNESIEVFGKKYPAYLEKYLFEWLFLFKTDVKPFRENQVSNKIVDPIVYTIQILFDLVMELQSKYSKIISEYGLTSVCFSLGDLDKENLKNLKMILANKSSYNSRVFKKYLSKFLFMISRNDLQEYHTLSRFLLIERVIRKSTKDFKDISEFSQEYVMMVIGMCATRLHNLLIIPSEGDNSIKTKSLLSSIGAISELEYAKKIHKSGRLRYFRSITSLWESYLINNNHPILLVNSVEGSPNTVYCGLVKELASLYLDRVRSNYGFTKFSFLMEEYLYNYFNEKLINSEHLLEKVYLYGHSFSYVKGKREIDFFIYNQHTKNIIIFELKVKNDLSSKIFHNQSFDSLTKVSGEIGHGINQLIEHHKHIDEIASKLGIVINDVQYVFLNFSKSIMWNSIVRDFCDVNITDSKMINYMFMSLEEFEFFIEICCDYGIDFFQLLKQKNHIKVGELHSAFILMHSTGTGEYRVVKEKGVLRGVMEDDMINILHYIKTNY